MDTTAYLTRQGWLGTGHSLHPTGRGIKKPLLISQKSNVLGIGKRKHDAHADQWWARAFDAGLKSLDVGRKETTGATETLKPGAWGALHMLKAGGQKWAGMGGLYKGFVRGEGLRGTITPEVLGADDTVQDGGGKRAAKKRKRCVAKRGEQANNTRERRQEKSRKSMEANHGNSMGEQSTPTAADLKAVDAGAGDIEERYREQGNQIPGNDLKNSTGQTIEYLEHVQRAERRKKKRRKHLTLADSHGDPSQLAADPDTKHQAEMRPSAKISKVPVEEQRKME